MKQETMLLTLALAKTQNSILLGMKKRGFGAGRWNGFGGKVESEETIEQAAIRELKEEINIDVIEIEKSGIIHFDLPSEEKILEVHLFNIKKYSGQPEETEEMKPEWFKLDEIPYDNMWSDDKYWMPLFLRNQKFVANFKFDKNDKVIEHKINEVDNL